MSEVPAPYRIPLLALAVLALLAAGVRVACLPREGLWLDEAVVLRGALPTPPSAAITDPSHGPLYPLLLRGWLQLTGVSVLAARVLSVVLGVLTVLIGAAIVASVLERRGLVIGGVLLALSPFLVYYAQEIGPEALLGLCAVVATWGLWGLCASSRPPLRAQVAFVLGTVLGLFTSPAALLVLAAHLIGGLTQCRRRRWVLLPCVGLSLLPALAWVHFSGSDPLALTAGRGASGLLLTPLVWLGGPAQMLHPLLYPTQTGSGLVVLAIVLLLVGGVTSACSMRTECLAPRYDWTLGNLLLVLVALPPLAMAALSWWRPVYHMELLLPSGLALVLFLALAVGRLLPERGTPAAAACALVFAIFLGAYWAGPGYGRGQTIPRVVAWLQQNTRPTDVLIFQNEALYLPTRVHADLRGLALPERTYLYATPRLDPQSRAWPAVTADLDPLAFIRQLAAARRVVIVKELDDTVLTPPDGKPLAEVILPGSTQTPTVHALIYAARTFLPTPRAQRELMKALQQSAPREAPDVH